MAIISRGFLGRRCAADAKLPPGQYLTTDFPVLSAGPTPRVSVDKWEFTIDDGNEVLKRWDWRSFRELPTESITGARQIWAMNSCGGLPLIGTAFPEILKASTEFVTP